MTQAQVVTGMVFPSAGVRILIPLVVSTFMEEASGEPMLSLSDYNIGMSVGSVPAAAFSMDTGDGQPAYRARDVFYGTFATALTMFNRDPDEVFINNVWYDAPPALRKILKNMLGAPAILHILESYRPTREAARYDRSVLENSLQARFGQARTPDAAKSFFIVAHNTGNRRPSLFGHIDSALYPRDPGTPMHLDHIPFHNDVSIVKAIMAATAIPGFIGSYCVDELDAHFMDTGGFSLQSVTAVMEDMHDLAAARFRAEHAARHQTSIRPVWQRLAFRPAREEPAPTPVSRLVVMGVGNDEVPRETPALEGSFVSEGEEIVRQANDGISVYTHSTIYKRFDTAARALTGSGPLRVIDTSIIPRTDAERATFPSTDIKDGRLENMMRLVEAGRRCAIENCEVICDEIMMRMRTLEARGQRTSAQVEAVARRLESVRTAEGAAEVCDSFMFRQEHVRGILEMQGIKDIERFVAGRAEPVRRGGFLGWGSTLVRAAASVKASII